MSTPQQFPQQFPPSTGQFPEQSPRQFSPHPPRQVAPHVPRHPSPQVPQEAPGAGQRGRARFGFGLVGPRRRRHAFPVESLDSLGLPVGDDGVVIGVDPENRPSVLGINRSEPYDVTLIGGLWTAQVLALRTAATGTRVAVETGRAAAWTALVQAAGGGLPCVTLHDVGRVPPQGASAGSPVLVVRDCGMRPPRGRVVSAPWQSVVTLLPYLSPAAPRLMEKSSLVGVQRVSPDEAARIGWLLKLPRSESQTLSTLADGVTLWVSGGDRRFVMTQPTDAEAGLLGAARRMD
ncbi:MULTISPECIES: hypothetical protein [unclassified Streptomyces]|uniref:hypothetical protein n=1 Tax=unclassified Streptomyces TaxID=2593676 RepID=UPI000AEBBC8C|nr:MULTISPECIES: hypothetical protein [unclassified Streptomyces]